MKQKHSELPWQAIVVNFVLNKPSKGKIMGIHQPIIEEGYEPSFDNCDFIVRACNSHYELLEACKEAFDELASINNSQRLIDKLDKAISKAEGK